MRLANCKLLSLKTHNHGYFLIFHRKECSVIDEASRVSYQDLTKRENVTDDVDNVPMETDHNPTDTDHEPTSFEHDPTDTDIQQTETDNDLIDSDNDPTRAEGNMTVSDCDTNDGGHGLNDSENALIANNGSNTNKTGEGANKKMRQTNAKSTKNKQAKVRTARPVRMKTLSACLNLFGLFKNPGKLFQEQAMKQIYLTLLTQKDGEIQKLAIACLMAYKFGYLLPYKENLDRLMEDKTFRDELMCFSSDEELNVVIPEHRAEFIHILIR